MNNSDFRVGEIGISDTAPLKSLLLSFPVFAQNPVAILMDQFIGRPADYIDWKEGRWLSSLEGELLTLFQNAVIASNHPLVIASFARDVAKADIPQLQAALAALHKLGIDPTSGCVVFATGVQNANVYALQAAVIAYGSTQSMNYFAQNVEASNITTIQRAIIESNDPCRFYALGQFAVINGANIPTIQAELIASGDLLSLRDLAFGASNNDYKKAEGVDVPLVIAAIKKHIAEKTHAYIHPDDLRATVKSIERAELDDSVDLCATQANNRNTGRRTSPRRQTRHVSTLLRR